MTNLIPSLVGASQYQQEKTSQGYDKIKSFMKDQRMKEIGRKFVQHGDITPTGLQKFAQENNLNTQEMYGLVEVAKAYREFQKSQQPTPDKISPTSIDTPQGPVMGMQNQTQNTFSPTTFASNASPQGPVIPGGVQGREPSLVYSGPSPKPIISQADKDASELDLYEGKKIIDSKYPSTKPPVSKGVNYNEEEAVGEIEGYITQEDVDPLQAQIEIEKFNRVAVRPYIYASDPGKEVDFGTRGNFFGRDTAPSIKKVNLPKTSDGIQATTEDVRAYQKKYGTDWKTAVNKIFEFAGQKSPY